MSEQLVEIRDGFDIDEAVQAGELELRVMFVDDGPGGGPFATPQAGVIGMRCTHLVEGSACSDGCGFVGGQRRARFGGFLFGELGSEQFSETFRGGFPPVLNVENVRGQTSMLIPGSDIGRGILGPAFDLVAGHRIAGEKAEADPLAVGDEPFVGWSFLADGLDGFVGASHGDAIGLREQFGFPSGSAAAPAGDFEARSEFWVDVIDGVSQQPEWERTLGGGFNELSRLEQ